MTALPLDGIRVLDSTYVFALPYTGGPTRGPWGRGYQD